MWKSTVEPLSQQLPLDGILQVQIQCQTESHFFPVSISCSTVLSTWCCGMLLLVAGNIIVVICSFRSCNVNWEIKIISKICIFFMNSVDFAGFVSEYCLWDGKSKLLLNFLMSGMIEYYIVIDMILITHI